MLEQRDYDFLHALWTRRAIFTYVLFAFNIFVFVLMELAGGTTNEATLLAFGVKSNPEIDQGQVWRLLTPIFIHIGLLHLFFNSYALWMVGPQVEKIYGGARFFILYVLTGVAGVLASYWRNPDVISAGASGAIFGLFGVLLVFGIKYRKSIPPFFQRTVGAGVLPVIVINLIIGFSFPAIDNAAHIGGLIAGGVLAFVLPYEQPGSSTHRSFTLARNALLAIIAVSFYQVATHYDGPSPSVRNLYWGWGRILGSKSSIQDFVDAVNTSQQTLDKSFRQMSSRRLDPGSLAGMKSELSAAVDSLERAPSISPRADQAVRELREIAQLQVGLVEDIERSGVMTYSQSRRALENEDRYAQVKESFSNWVKLEGAKHGIQHPR